MSTTSDDDAINWQQQAETYQDALETALQHAQDLEEQISQIKKRADVLVAHHKERADKLDKMWQEECTEHQAAVGALAEYHGQQLDRLNERISRLKTTIAQRDKTITERDQEIERLKSMLAIQQKLLRGL